MSDQPLCPECHSDDLYDAPGAGYYCGDCGAYFYDWEAITQTEADAVMRELGDQDEPPD